MHCSTNCNPFSQFSHISLRCVCDIKIPFCKNTNRNVVFILTHCKHKLQSILKVYSHLTPMTPIVQISELKEFVDRMTIPTPPP